MMDRGKCSKACICEREGVKSIKKCGDDMKGVHMREFDEIVLISRPSAFPASVVDMMFILSVSHERHVSQLHPHAKTWIRIYYLP